VIVQTFMTPGKHDGVACPAKSKNVILGSQNHDQMPLCYRSKPLYLQRIPADEKRA
jgi:hypothetical protein